jgi:hypothetical protein
MLISIHVSYKTNTKRLVVMQRVFAMSHYRSVQIEGSAFKPSDRATLRQHDNAPFDALSCCRYRQDEKAITI